jgi:Homeodomain-like domain
VYSLEIRAKALALSASGRNDCEVARLLDIPRTTIRDWRHLQGDPRPPGPTCPRCWRPFRRPIEFDAADYSELLALYLGDGHIVRTGRSDRLRIFLDTRYSLVIAEAEALLRRCFQDHRVARFRSARGTTTILSLYSTHLACLFPQHGPGRKHKREIALEAWQAEIVAREPWAFLRGCIRSDGCVFVNRTGRYSYVSYDFSNRSEGILDLFTSTCDAVGVEYRAYPRHVRIYRRASVALMQEHVGGKL